MILAGLSYLAALDPTTRSAEAQARCLQALEQGDAISTAARRGPGRVHCWRGVLGRRGLQPHLLADPPHPHHQGRGPGTSRLGPPSASHPKVVAALAEGTALTESMARAICGWTDKIPAPARDAADEILVGAARAGARQEDLAGLAAEIDARSLADSGDDNDRLPNLQDRRVRVQTTFGGAGVISAI